MESLKSMYEYCFPKISTFNNCLSFSEMGTVPVGGSGDVRLERAEYDFAKAAVKPSQLVLRLVDKLFSKEVLMRSTVHGTKDFDALDQKVIAAIKGKLSYIFK